MACYLSDEHCRYIQVTATQLQPYCSICVCVDRYYPTLMPYHGGAGQKIGWLVGGGVGVGGFSPVILKKD